MTRGIARGTTHGTKGSQHEQPWNPGGNHNELVFLSQTKNTLDDSKFRDRNGGNTHAQSTEKPHPRFRVIFQETCPLAQSHSTDWSPETGMVKTRNQGRVFRVAMSPEKEEETANQGGRRTGREDEMKKKTT